MAGADVGAPASRCVIVIITVIVVIVMVIMTVSTTGKTIGKQWESVSNRGNALRELPRPWAPRAPHVTTERDSEANRAGLGV